MKYTKESFAQELEKRFPDNKIEILEFNGTAKPIKYRCLSCNRIIEKSRANHLYENKSLCQRCYPTKYSKYREWIQKFFSTSVQFKLLQWSQNTADNIYMHCNKCGFDFYKEPANLFGKEEKTICPYCGDNGVPLPQQLYEKLMLEKGYNDYKIISYKALRRSVKFQHSCGYVFSQIGINFLKSRGCPKCSGKKSKGELCIEEYLLQNHINYIYNFSIKELNNLSYDFYLPEYHTFIEYQGQQHYFAVDYFGGEQKFQTQLLHDKIKREYALKNNYHLIIIPYTDYNNIISYLIPIGSTTSSQNVVSSEAKEKTL